MRYTLYIYTEHATHMMFTQSITALNYMVELLQKQPGSYRSYRVERQATPPVASAPCGNDPTNPLDNLPKGN